LKKIKPPNWRSKRQGTLEQRRDQVKTILRDFLQSSEVCCSRPRTADGPACPTASLTLSPAWVGLNRDPGSTHKPSLDRAVSAASRRFGGGTEASLQPSKWSREAD